jgi:hypothetical protein
MCYTETSTVETQTTKGLSTEECQDAYNYLSTECKTVVAIVEVELQTGTHFMRTNTQCKQLSNRLLRAIRENESDMIWFAFYGNNTRFRKVDKLE